MQNKHERLEQFNSSNVANIKDTYSNLLSHSFLSVVVASDLSHDMYLHEDKLCMFRQETKVLALLVKRNTLHVCTGIGISDTTNSSSIMSCRYRGDRNVK